MALPDGPCSNVAHAALARAGVPGLAGSARRDIQSALMRRAYRPPGDRTTTAHSAAPVRLARDDL